MIGSLYLVATPIGNLKDISLRAIETLNSVDIIACEDTRQTRKLLSHYQIKVKRIISYNEHNERERIEKLEKMLLEGKSVALVSDAGTPLISDPGYRLVKKAHEIGVKVFSIPGPTAFVSAVVVSGLPTDAVFFSGFLPSRKSDRIAFLRKIKFVPATLCFYESPRRVKESLQDCLEALGNREAAVVREISKVHEEILRGSIKDILEMISEDIKGELVLIIDRERRSKQEEVDAEEVIKVVSSY